MKRSHRRILIGLAALAVLLVLAVIVTELVLRSAYPRRLVLGQLEKQTGLRVTADRFRTGWWGRSEFEGVEFSLPLSDEPLLAAPRLEASHAALLSILLWRDVDLRSVRLEEPTIVLREDATGRWNLQEALELIARRQAKPPGTRGGGPSLPEVTVERGTLRVAPQADGETVLRDVAFAGEPIGAGGWRFEATARPGVDVKGRLLAGADWQHEVEFALAEVAPLVEPWVALPDPARARVAGSWRGRWREGALSGRLRLSDSAAAGVSVAGSAGVRIQDAVITVRPEELRVSGPRVPAAVTVTRGEVVVQGDDVRAHDLRVRLMNGAAVVSAEGDRRELTGRLDAVWSDMVVADNLRHAGTLRVTVGQPRPGLRLVDAALESTGTTPWGTWDAGAKLSGTGQQLESMSWTITSDRIAWADNSRNKTYRVRNVEARVAVDGSQIRLQDIHAEEPTQLDGEGLYDLETRKWALTLTGQNVRVDYGGAIEVGMRVEAAGDGARIEVREAQVTHPRFRATASGTYVAERPEPVNLDVTLVTEPTPADAGSARRRYPRYDELRAQVRLAGTARPLRLAMTGTVAGENVRWEALELGRIEGPITGTFDERAGTEFEASGLSMLEGTWRIRGNYDPVSRVATLAVVADSFDVRYANAFAADPLDLGGRMSLEVTARLPRWNLDALTATGNWQIVEPFFRGVTAERAAGEIRLEDRRLVIDSIELTKGDGRIHHAFVRLPLDQPTVITASAQVTDWPLELPEQEVTATVNGAADVQDFDVTQRTGRGSFDLSSTLAYDDRQVGEARFTGRFRGGVIEIELLTATMLEGRAEGKGTLVLDHPLRSTFQLSWSDLEAKEVAALLPALPYLAEARGTFSGAVTLGPDTDPRALAPHRLDMEINAKGAGYRDVSVERAYVTAYFDDADEDAAGSRRGDGPRAILNRCEVHVAEGVLRLWGRASRRPASIVSRGEPEYFFYARADFENLNLEQIERSITQDDEPVIGRIAGDAMLNWFGPDWRTLDWDRLNGQANLRLTQSDLANVNVLGLLYRTMNFQMGQREPAGHGELRVRLEGTAAIIEHLRYQNQGLEVRTSFFEVKDVRQAQDSPIEGILFGSASVLPRLEIFRAIDEAVQALQAGVTTLKVRGTVGEPEAVPYTLGEVQSSLRALLVGESGGGTRR